jgi:hypothetical protein
MLHCTRQRVPEFLPGGEGEKLPRRDVDHSSRSSTKVKNERSYNLLPVYAFMPWTGKSLPFYLSTSLYCKRSTQDKWMYDALVFWRYVSVAGSQQSDISASRQPSSPSAFSRRGALPLQSPYRLVSVWNVTWPFQRHLQLRVTALCKADKIKLFFYFKQM